LLCLFLSYRATGIIFLTYVAMQLKLEIATNLRYNPYFSEKLQ